MKKAKIFKNGQEVQTIVGADLQGLWNGIQNELAINNQESTITSSTFVTSVTFFTFVAYYHEMT